MGKMRFIALVFTVVGLLFVGLGVQDLVKTTRFLHRAQLIDGVVTESIERHETSTDADGKQHETTYFYPRVRFRTASGQFHEFVLSTGSNPPSYHTGSTVKVLFDPADPSATSLKDWSLWFGAEMFIGIGGLAAAAGIALLIAVACKKKKENWLHLHGKQILADFSAVKFSAPIQADDASFWHVLCQWLDPGTNKIHVFKSDALPFDPTAYITVHQIPVLLDSNNFNRYWVDLSFLPMLARKEPFGWKSLVAWPRHKLETYRARWRAITGASLDVFLMGLYYLCMIGLLRLAGALNENMQLLLTAILVFGAVQFSLWQRRALGWRWPGPAADYVRGLLFTGGIGLVFFIGFAFLLPIREPANLPWYLVVGGLLAFNFLRIAGVITLTHADFRQSCRNTSATAPAASAALPGEAVWKRLSRTAYQIAFAAVWLVTIGYFFLYGLAVQMASGLPDYIEKLPARQRALLLMPIQQPFLGVLQTALYIAFPCVILIACLLQFLLDVPLLPKREPISSRPDSTSFGTTARSQETTDSARSLSQKIT